MKKIQSNDNKIIKLVESLKSSRGRKKSKLFLVDGVREVQAALNANFEAKYFFVKSENFFKENNLTFQKVNKSELELILLSESLFKKISYKEKTDELIAVFEIKEKKIADINLLEINKESLIILEGLEKPGNLGAIIRTTYAAGLNNIILNNCPIDQFNSNVIRASEGLVFFVNIIKDSKENTLKFLKDNKIKSIAASTDARKNYSEINFQDNKAIILGSEAFGLSDFWLSNASELTRIPMKRGVDSLNVSVSTAILIYESVKENGFNNLK